MKLTRVNKGSGKLYALDLSHDVDIFYGHIEIYYHIRNNVQIFSSNVPWYYVEPYFQPYHLAVNPTLISCFIDEIET